MVNYNGDFLCIDELEALNFGSLGKNVLIHKTAVLINCENIRISDRVRIDAFTVLSVASGLYIGKNVHIGSHCSLLGSSEISIGDFAGLSHGVRVFSANDDYTGIAMTNPTVPQRFRQTHSSPVTIGRHAIIGSNCVVLPGTNVHEGAAIGALSFVRGTLPEWTIYAGTPLRRIRERARTPLELEKSYLSEER